MIINKLQKYSEGDKLQLNAYVNQDTWGSVDANSSASLLSNYYMRTLGCIEVCKTCRRLHWRGL